MECPQNPRSLVQGTCVKPSMDSRADCAVWHHLAGNKYFALLNQKCVSAVGGAKMFAAFVSCSVQNSLLTVALSVFIFKNVRAYDSKMSGCTPNSYTL